MIKRTQIEVHVFTLNTFLLLAEALTGQLMLVYDSRKKIESKSTDYLTLCIFDANFF